MSERVDATHGIGAWQSILCKGVRCSTADLFDEQEELGKPVPMERTNTAA